MAEEKNKKPSDTGSEDKDWNDRIAIYKEKYGKDPDPDTDLEGLDNIITDEMLADWRAKNTVQAKDGNDAPVSEPMPHDVFIERIKTRMPDAKYDEDEEEVYRQAGSLLDMLENDSKKYKDFKDKLTDRFREDPEVAQALLDWMNDGTPLMAAIRRYKGDEALTMREGDEGWDAYQKAGEERKADRERMMTYAQELKNNAAESDKVFNEWAQELELDDEQKKAVWDLINNDINDMMRGKLSKDVYNRYRNALNHDPDVEAAKRQGEIDGKNAAIEAKRQKMKGSGLPNGQAGGESPEEKQLSPREMMAQRFSGFRRG